MKNEQREAIDRLNKDKKCSLDFEGYITIVRVADLNTALSLIKEQEKQIDLMARAFKQDDVRTVEEIKQIMEEIRDKESK